MAHVTDARAPPFPYPFRNFGALIGLAGLCLLPASLFFSTLLASGLYDAAARRQEAEAAATGAAPIPNGVLYCSGPSCFNTFFFIMAAVALLECCVAAVHWRRMGGFYTRLAAKRATEKSA
jgi:hypothetical protein